MVDDMIFFSNLFKSPDEGDDVERKCSGDFSMVPFIYWELLYPKFCEEVNKDPKKELIKTYSHDEIKPQKRSYPIDKRSPPPDPQLYNGLRFGFEWSGGDCQQSCEDTYHDLAQWACKFFR